MLSRRLIIIWLVYNLHWLATTNCWAASVEQNSGIARLYADICANNNQEISHTLDSVELVKELAIENRKRGGKLKATSGQSNDPSQACPLAVRQAIDDLYMIVTYKEEHVCSQSKANIMRDFHSHFLINKLSTTPQPIKRFFVAYGLQVSQLCRHSMIKQLAELEHNKMDTLYRNILSSDSSDHPLAAVADADNIISKTPIEQHDDLIIPENLPQLLKINPHESPNLEPSFNASYSIKTYQLICKSRFEPIYKPLIMPLVTLTSIGFNYHHRHHFDSSTRQLVYQWYKTLFICETLNSFEIDTSGDTESQPVPSADQRDEDESLDLSQQRSAFNELVYKRLLANFKAKQNVAPRAIVAPKRVDNLIIDPNDKSLMDAVDKYLDTQNWSGVRFLRQTFGSMGEKLRSGFGKMFKKDTKQIEKDTKELIRSLEKEGTNSSNNNKPIEITSKQSSGEQQPISWYRKVWNSLQFN